MSTRDHERDADAPKPSPTAGQPESIGPYRVVSLLGEGGMGTVYKAVQSEPVRRTVAIKVVKLGMDSQSVLRRFDVERQALAMMNHDAIARVFDAGTTERGQPYFVMEYVPGVPLTVHCERERSTLEQRLDLFAAVCSGVQHAHQKGVIHRDLKPGNVLVTTAQGHAVPKIIDFGLARATDQLSLAQSMFTEQGHVIGTPEYMSPEQADPGNLDIDSRTDVYSLGVILYELLVGALPFSMRELRDRGLLEMQRVVREVDPPRPSDRLTRMGPGAEAQASSRKTTVTVLRRALRTDLDWVVLKAMEKDRGRRYATPDAMADDVRRFLESQPVVAGPPSARYRLNKFLRRYRGQAIAAALLFVTLVGGITATTIFAVEADRRAEEVARLLGEADRQSARLREKVDQFNLLSNVVLLQTAREAETTLFPAWPERVVEIRAWIDRYAEPLRAARPRLQAAVDVFRARALPWTAEQQERDRRDHPDLPSLTDRREQLRSLERVRADLQGLEGAARLDRLRNLAMSLGDTSIAALTPAELDARISGLDREVGELERRVSSRRSWEFDDPETGFLHARLAPLIDEIDRFDAGTAQRVEERLRWAERIEDLSVSLHRDRWSRARASIQTSAHYRGGRFELEPQIGLVPIGENPATGLWEFYHLRSASDPDVVPAHRPDGSIAVDADTGIVFVLVPGGSFLMGAQHADPDADNFDPLADVDEAPVEPVGLQPYFLARHEMTQAQWKRLSDGDEPSLMRPGWLSNAQELLWTNPVESVSWERCVALLAEHGLRLPTEAQWEQACRGGTTTPWSSGAAAESVARVANLADQTASSAGLSGAHEAWSDGFILHAPVGSFAANAFGFFDMHGNIQEWCADGAISYLDAPREGDGLRDAPDAANRITRGGSFMNPSARARSAARHGTDPGRTYNYVGLRPARALSR